MEQTRPKSSWELRAQAAEARVGQLKAYARHHETCPQFYEPIGEGPAPAVAFGPCDCGLEAALSSPVEATPDPTYGSEVLCDACARVFCPHGENLHFHHDGCPACEPAAEATAPSETKG